MPNQISRFMNYFSRSRVKARNNLGVVMGDEREGVRKTRKKELELYDSYYNGEQYAKLPPWDDAHDKSGEYIPVRKRQPRIVYNFAKVICDRVSSKLVGDDCFPALKIEDSPDDNEFIRMVVKGSRIKRDIMDTIKKMCLSGSSLLRFYMAEGCLVLETFHANHCYPQFSPSGKLSFVKIMYVFEDENDRDDSGNCKRKWFRLDLSDQSDTLYNTPDYNADAEPVFTPVSVAEHNLGFVQAEWFRTGKEKFSPDGPSLIADVLDFIDEMNYSLSQSSQAVGYGQEPQMTVSGIDADDLDKLIKSSNKAWNLGKSGEAKFVETNLEGVKVANELRDKVRLAVQDVARIVMLDPEKMAAHAQSGEAMKVLHGPLAELINELRPMIEDSIIELVVKLALTVLIMNSRGMETEIVIPDGYVPDSLMLSAHWNPVFPMTLDDLLKKSQAAVALTQASIMSQEWATTWIAPDVGIEDVEGERAKIAAQPPMNPFGDPFGGQQQQEEPANAK